MELRRTIQRHYENVLNPIPSVELTWPNTAHEREQTSKKPTRDLRQAKCGDIVCLYSKPIHKESYGMTEKSRRRLGHRDAANLSTGTMQNNEEEEYSEV